MPKSECPTKIAPAELTDSALFPFCALTDSAIFPFCAPTASSRVAIGPLKPCVSEYSDHISKGLASTAEKGLLPR